MIEASLGTHQPKNPNRRSQQIQGLKPLRPNLLGERLGVSPPCAILPRLKPTAKSPNRRFHHRGHGEHRGESHCSRYCIVSGVHSHLDCISSVISVSSVVHNKLHHRNPNQNQRPDRHFHQHRIQIIVPPSTEPFDAAKIRRVTHLVFKFDVINSLQKIARHRDWKMFKQCSAKSIVTFANSVSRLVARKGLTEKLKFPQRLKTVLKQIAVVHHPESHECD